MCDIKDFLGPAATIIAAFTAAGIAWYFAWQQARIAQQQANTALDQLRHSSFEKRYAIYKDVQDLIRLLINEADKAEFRPFEVLPHYVVMDEAMFFFPPEICAWMRQLKNDCQSFLSSHAARGRNPEEYSNKQQRLVDHLTEMPQRFEQELRLRQLTDPPSG
jgi:hypothetical protein